MKKTFVETGSPEDIILQSHSEIDRLRRKMENQMKRISSTKNVRNLDQDLVKTQTQQFYPKSYKDGHSRMGDPRNKDCYKSDRRDQEFMKPNYSAKSLSVYNDCRSNLSSGMHTTSNFFRPFDRDYIQKIYDDNKMAKSVKSSLKTTPPTKKNFTNQKNRETIIILPNNLSAEIQEIEKCLDVKYRPRYLKSNKTSVVNNFKDQSYNNGGNNRISFRVLIYNESKGESRTRSKTPKQSMKLKLSKKVTQKEMIPFLRNYLSSRKAS